MAKVELSDSIQDYLKELYKLQASGERATTTTVARRMQSSLEASTA